MSQQPTNTEAELLEFVHSIDVRAPAALHERIEALVAASSEGRATPSTHTSSRRVSLRLGLGGAVAAAAVVTLALVLGSSGTGAPALNVSEATALTLRPATMAAPAENPRADAQLAANVDGVAFPYWEDHFGWRSTGARTDHVGGRDVMTVFYSNSSGRQIGYAIVAGTPAPKLSGGVVDWRGGTPYRVLSKGASRVVLWLRDGHLCVLAGRDLDSATLLKLASWNDRDDTTA
jgi:hypothetical protein